MNSTINQFENSKSNQTFITAAKLNTSIIPKIGKAEMFYQQSNTPHPFEFIPNSSTVLGYNIGFELSESVMLFYKVRTTYIVDSDQFDSFKPMKSIQIETQFSL